MQITRQAEYAIKIMLELARHEGKEVVSSKLIAERQGIPEDFLKKTVHLLALQGLVVTQRGVQGGVRLGKPAGEITIADIIAAVEGPLAINICLDPGYECPNKPTCAVHRVLARGQAALLRELSRETLSDLLSAGPE
ncbi:MAG: Rrf2 family transcriptional regulator [Syntrophomonadaceae bacterium]|jgi:Rrf2 family protein|nr:Rrf2 family transcriptional regulator [Syntrophomonadaceae bacterium]